MSNSKNNQFCKSNLYLDPVTLVLKLDLDMVKMYHHTKNEISMLRHSKVIVQKDRHTHTHTEMDRHTDSMKTLPSDICEW